MAKVFWFVEPLDEFTDKSLAHFLVENHMLDPNNFNLHGKSVLVYRVNHSVITKLKNSEFSTSFKYNVYKKVGNKGKLIAFSFKHLKTKVKYDRQRIQCH